MELQVKKTALSVALSVGVVVCTMSGTVEAVDSSILRNYSSGSCAYPATQSVGAPILHGACNAGDAQRWKVEYVVKDGYPTNSPPWFRLRNAQTNLCIDTQNNGSAPGVKLVQNVCSLSNTQLWSWRGTSVRYYDEIVNPYGNCMDNPPDTTPVQIWQCTGSHNQKWFLSGK